MELHTVTTKVKLVQVIFLWSLTVAQESRLRDISAQYQKQRLSLVEEAKALASSEYQRKLLEFERRDAEITAQVRQKLNALLSARQLAGLEKIAFYNRVASALWDSSVQNKIALSEQQKTRLREILADGGKEADAAYRAVTEKLLGIITAAQRQKLQEELSRNGRW